MRAGFTGTLDTLLDTLNNIRLSTVLEMSGERGRPKATRLIEEVTEDQKRLMDGLNLADVHTKPVKLKGISVYYGRKMRLQSLQPVLLSLLQRASRS